MKMRVLSCVCALAALPLVAEVSPVVVDGAPFPLTVAEWTPPARDFVVTAYGAKLDGKPVTEAIEAAVAAAAQAGGGRVVLPKGEWCAGAFDLTNNVALVLEAGAILHFPDDPVIVSRRPLSAAGRPQLTRPALINAAGCTNVAVMGAGTILSDVAYWHDNFNLNPKKGFPRPQVMHFERCRNVRVEGVQVRGSPAWTMHFKVCEDIVMRRVDSICTGPNTDGLDLESCNRALIEDCSLDQTDDTYTIKSGMNEAGRRRNIPTQNVVIRRCRAVHGHTLLGIGSEVSGGIRNIYMTDCAVTGDGWRFLFVKTNAKRGAFVENVWMENVRGTRAGTSVFETEMYYDGNPNKELTGKGASEWPTAISNINVRNVLCAEAGSAVKVRGDKARPPRALTVENVRVGRLRGKLVSASNAPELVVKDVREDPAVVCQLADVPSNVRAFDPQKDAVPTAPEVDFRAFSELSANSACRQLRDLRIASEVAAQRNVAPRLTPTTAPRDDEVFSGAFARRLFALCANWGCALEGAWIADDVTSVAQDRVSGVELKLTVDARLGDLHLMLANKGTVPLTNLWGVVLLAPQHMTCRQTFRVARLEPGACLERVLPFGAGHHYHPLPSGPAPYAAAVDFTQGSVRRRLWVTTEASAPTNVPNLNACARHVGPVDGLELDDADLLRLSTETGALPAVWKGVAFPGAAWYNAAPRSRPYTDFERRLVRAGRAWEASAIQFDVPTNTTSIFRWTVGKGVAFLNGERIELKGRTQALPVRTGRNRLIVKYPCVPGDRTACLQTAVYPWAPFTSWPCVPFPTVSEKGTARSSAVTEATFPLEWTARNATDVPYEVEIATNKLVAQIGLAPRMGFAVAARAAAGEKDIPVTVLNGRTPGVLALRFAVPAGTTGLVCRVGGRAQEVSDPNQVDNLFAGASTQTARWKGTPRMKIEEGILLSARSPGNPEATCTVDVPAVCAGKSVRFELGIENLAASSWSCRMRVRQFDAAGKRLPEEVVDERWLGFMLPAKRAFHFLERGRLHPEAKQVQFFLSMGAGTRPYDRFGLPNPKPDGDLPRLAVTCLALRPAELLPFPKYDEGNFAAGVENLPGDGAIRLGGPDGQAFWYQTRSSASWSGSVSLPEERQIFFPMGAGTVEAWFKSAWRPTVSKQNGKTRCCPIILFQAYQGARMREGVSGCGEMLRLAYRPEPGTLELSLKDDAKTSFAGETPCVLPVDAWCHVAVQWAPGGVAEVFVDGKRVLSLPIPGWHAVNLADPDLKYPNDHGPHEFYLGSSRKSVHDESSLLPEMPLYEGVVDNLRVSTGRRYAAPFTPAKSFTCDAATRALFTFDRSFEGVSGGGLGWIPGTTRSTGAGRVARDLVVNGKTVPWWPRGITAENDPNVVFDLANYGTLPTAEDFRTLRRPFRRTAVLKPGESLNLACPEKVVTDFVEIANEGDRPLRYPILLNTDDIDPRSFGDFAETLGGQSLPPRARVEKVFGYVLGAMDYFMNHTARFAPGSDKPEDVEYQPLYMLNGYCGFECGPLNNMAANLFVEAAGCPAVQAAGYGHSFEEVFYDGAMHVYDLSFRRFFAAMDNEMAAGLGEMDDEAGVFNRQGVAPECFVRNSMRGHWVQGPSCVPKIGVTLNPGEAFRVWQVNDGACNDLIVRAKTGRWKGSASKFRPDYTEPCHAVTETHYLQRTERYFPHSLSGFLTFDGEPAMVNPAFTDMTPTSFCYRVQSGGYPIVQASYVAQKRDGSRAALELSTDGGRSFRSFTSPANYAVRARYAYLIRVKAALADVARFTATTEVQLNPRIFPGRFRAGANELRLKAVGEGTARVTVQGRYPAGRIEIPAAVSSGAVVGTERLFFAFDSSERPVLDMLGVSPQATVRTTRGLKATLRAGKLTLESLAKDVRFEAVTIVDGEAEKTLAILVGPRVRFATARTATVKDGATLLPPDTMSPQVRGLLKAANHGAEIAFPFAPLPKGKYAVMNLNRYRNPAGGPRESGVLHDDHSLRMIWPGLKSTDAGSSHNLGCDFKRGGFGRPGEMAQFKWDYPWHPGTYYPYPNIRVADYPAGDGIRFRSWDDAAEVEVAAVLVVPDPNQKLRGDLTKVLCGLNCDPWRMGNEQEVKE